MLLCHALPPTCLIFYFSVNLCLFLSLCRCNTWTFPPGINTGLSHLISSHWRPRCWHRSVFCPSVFVRPSLREGQPEEQRQCSVVGRLLHQRGQQSVLHLLLQPAAEVRHTHIYTQVYFKVWYRKTGCVMLWNSPRWRVFVTTGDYRWPLQPAASHGPIFTSQFAAFEVDFRSSDVFISRQIFQHCRKFSGVFLTTSIEALNVKTSHSVQPTNGTN